MTGCIGTGKISEMGQTKAGFFPFLVGIDLHGKKRLIPDSFLGKLNLVAVAFERKQQADVDTWIDVAEEWMLLHKDLRFYEVPLIYKVNAPYRFWINNGMRSGISESVARERTITVYTDREAFLSMMNMKVEKISILLLDDGGKILCPHDGPTTEEAVREIGEMIMKYENY